MWNPAVVARNRAVTTVAGMGVPAGEGALVRMRPAFGLTGLTAASWAAVTAVDMLNLPDHVWEAALAVAAASTLAVLQTVVVIERNKIMASLANAALTRPMYRDDPTGPQPVTPRRAPAAPASLDELRRRLHGQHANSR